MMAQTALQGETLAMSRQQAEAVFLEKNLLLLAEKLNISQAEAMIVQAKLWPNPNISIEEVNLWASQGQLSYFGETLPPLAGNAGTNRQISAQLEQLVLTAGKRKKLIALEEVSRDMAAEYFEELLRGLKAGFRSQLTALQYLQAYQVYYTRQLASLESLLQAYSNQVAQGNIPRGEYVRLKALQLELEAARNGLQKELFAAQTDLKVLMGLPANTSLSLTEAGFLPDMAKVEGLSLAALFEAADGGRPDLRVARLEESYFDRLHRYEKAQRVPDLTFSAGYDRGGNFMLNFIGFGVGLDIPVFNRNQGNIRFAELGMEKSRLLTQEKTLRIQAETHLAYQNLMAAKALLDSIEPGYPAELDQLLESYTRSFRARNIGMLEYLDFLDAYLDNKKTILEAQKSVNDHFEELQFAIGKDLD